eukprot:982242-Prymnesium_polylepis.1
MIPGATEHLLGIWVVRCACRGNAHGHRSRAKSVIRAGEGSASGDSRGGGLVHTPGCSHRRQRTAPQLKHGDRGPRGRATV